MNKTIYTLVLICSMISTQVFSQKFDWAQRGGHYAYDYGWGTATDAAGNVFVAGKYEEVGAIFGPFTLPCAGNHDIFVAKYNSSGVIQWIRTAGGPGGDYAHAVCVDPLGNVIIAGEIEDTGHFGAVKVAAQSPDNDIFIAKYTTNGDLVYVKLAGGYTNDKAYAVNSDKDGNAYITGHFEGTAKFGSSISLTSVGTKDIFVAKYDANGLEKWAVRAGSANTDEGKGISINAAGELYVTGFYRGTADFNSTTSITSNSPTYDDIFVARYDLNGNLVWVKTAGGAYDDDAWALTTNNSGKIFVTGEFNAYAYFDGTTTHNLTTSGNADMFIAAYDNTGAVQWVTRGGGPLIDRARGICTDGTNVFVTGQYGAKGVFGTTTLTSPDSSDVFVASYDGSGAFRWALSSAGPADPPENLGFESGLGITIDNAGTVYASGSYLGPSNFGSTALPPFTRTDMFVTRVAQTGVNGTVGIADLKNLSGLQAFEVFPNPNNGKFTLAFTIAEKDNYSIELTSMLGQVVYAEKLSAFEGSYSKILETGNVNKGLYTIKLINSNNESLVRKIIVY